MHPSIGCQVRRGGIHMQRSLSMNSPLISVIVPVYKAEDLLDRCVESLVRQSYERLEILLVSAVSYKAVISVF